ncbi:MAG: YfhO family protein [Lachnospiraceae bacterium]|nr:YfhO family protein [Lachnospiraceae bacterium]
MLKKDNWRILDKNILNLFLLVTLMFTVIYHKFLFGEKVYVATWDAFYQFTSYYRAIRRTLLSGKFPDWTFQMGIGGTFHVESLGDVFSLLSALVNDEKAYIYIELLKVYLTAFFSYQYLGKLNFQTKISIYGAISYTFCGMMIVRAPWYSYSTEMFYFAVIIFGCELFFQDGKKGLLITSIVLFFARSGGYQIILSSIFLLAYTIIRYYIVGGYDLRKCLMESAKIYITSVMISAVFLIPTIIATLNAGRFSNQVSGLKFEQWLPEKDRMLAVVCGFLSESLAGPANCSSFQPDGLDGPLFYIGIINIFLLVIGINLANRKIKKVSYFGLALFFLYLFCPNVTYLYNLGVANYYYKLFVVWIAMFLVVLACMGLKNILNAEENLNISVKVCFIFVSLLTYIAFIDEYSKERIVRDVAIYCIILFLLYMAMFLCMDKIQHKVKLFLFCLIIEYIFMSIPTIDLFVTNSVSFAELYDSELEYICEELYSKDKFFRLDFKGERAEALKYNFYGTSYWTMYMGKSYIEFLKNTTRNYSYWSNRGDGAINNPLIEQILGVRYTIKPKGSREYTNYIYDKSYGKYDSFYNPYAYDLITVFDKYMYEEEYSEKNISQKQLSLLDTLVVRNEAEVGELKHDASEKYMVSETVYPRLSTWAEMLTMSETDYKFNVLDNADLEFYFDKAYNGNYMMSFIMSGAADVDAELLYRKGEEEFSVGKICISENGESNTFSIDEGAIDCFIVRINNSGTYTLNNLHVDIQDICSQPVVTNAPQLSSFSFILFENNHVIGQLESYVDGKAMISIPCERGWNLYVDGVKTSIEKVDFGLMAFECSVGSHTVELIYRRPGLRLGIIISLTTLIIYVGYSVYLKRRNKGMQMNGLG